jgi:hypothetical protein
MPALLMRKSKHVRTAPEAITTELLPCMAGRRNYNKLGIGGTDKTEAQRQIL